jgi:hypothetical protein
MHDFVLALVFIAVLMSPVVVASKARMEDDESE